MAKLKLSYRDGYAIVAQTICPFHTTPPLGNTAKRVAAFQCQGKMNTCLHLTPYWLSDHTHHGCWKSSKTISIPVLS
jgi:hypothetical protein